jgi:DNA-binding MarR family transcriptional regulator
MIDDPIAFRVFNEIGIIEQLARTRFERVMPEGLTLPQFIVLNHFVRLGGERSPAALAAAMQVTKATMTSTLQRLEAKRLVQIAPDPDDGRAKRVSLTAQGRRLRDQAVAALGPELAWLTTTHGADALADLLPRLVALRTLLDTARDR